MPDKVILSDTSVLIALSNIDELDILHKVYKNITITSEVSKEFGEDLPSWITINEVMDRTKIDLLLLELDAGEASSIVLALEKTNSILIIDEKKGRMIAKRMGLVIIGLLGVLVKAKELNKITSLRPILERLENVGFRISSKLKNKILNRVGEDI